MECVQGARRKSLITTWVITSIIIEIQYHEGKANVVVDALSRKATHGVHALVVADVLCKVMSKLNLEVVPRGKLEGMINNLSIQPATFDEIKDNQVGDVKLDRIREKIKQGKTNDFRIHDDGSIRFKGRW